MAEEDVVDDERARRFAQLFQTEIGKYVINDLRDMTVERFLGPLASDRELRHLEGQRNLVKTIEILIERGRK